jgi:ribosomal protein L37AE/L43A
MARNPVQFQKGMSLAEFNARYGTEQQCHSALVAMRWPEGFVCPKCEAREHSYHAARRLFQCTTCLTQTSVTAGTIFHKSRTPLDKWFLAIHLITQSKNDIAALELSRQLGVKWDTAWLIKQKLMEVMRERNQTYKLEGEVQIDDAYLGGEKAGTRGRGASMSPSSPAAGDQASANSSGQYWAWQHQERNYRHLPLVWPAAHCSVPRSLRVSVQPALRTGKDGRSVGRVAAKTTPRPYKTIVNAETSG